MVIYIYIYITLQTLPCGLQKLMRKIKHCFTTNYRVLFQNLLPYPTHRNSHQLQNMQYNLLLIFCTARFTTYSIINKTTVRNLRQITSSSTMVSVPYFTIDYRTTLYHFRGGSNIIVFASHSFTGYLIRLLLH